MAPKRTCFGGANDHEAGTSNLKGKGNAPLVEEPEKVPVVVNQVPADSQDDHDEITQDRRGQLDMRSGFILWRGVSHHWQGLLHKHQRDPPRKAPLKRPPTEPANKRRKKRSQRKSESREGDEDIEEDPDDEEADDVLDIDSSPIENLDREDEPLGDLLSDPLLGINIATELWDHVANHTGGADLDPQHLFVLADLRQLHREIGDTQCPHAGLGSIRRFLGSLTCMGVMDAQAALGGMQLCICNFPTNTRLDIGVGDVPSWNTYADDLAEAAFIMAYEFMEIGSPPFSKEVQFLDGILEELYSLCGPELDVNILTGVYDAKEMVLTDDDASILQVLDDDDEVVFLEDASILLCDGVDAGDDVDILISHCFYVFMLDDIWKVCQGTQVKSFQFQGNISDWRDLRLKNGFLDVFKGECMQAILVVSFKCEGDFNLLFSSFESNQFDAEANRYFLNQFFRKINCFGKLSINQASSEVERCYRITSSPL
ncbi:hypothetical protein L7F22_035977 [Adiantum nelumboides]|nr:hypothetical protein [Adiantum nelumboides]